MQYTPLWTSILRSPKVFALDPDAFRFWILCLALAQENDNSHGNLPDVESVAFTLHEDEREVRRLAAKLIDAGFLDATDDGLCVHNWKKWRHRRDVTAAVRKQRQRDREKGENGSTGLARDPASASYVTDVTRDMKCERDIRDQVVTRDMKPLKAVRKSEKWSSSLPSPIQVNSDVTRVTRDSACHESHATNKQTEQTQHTHPLPPHGGGKGGSERVAAPPDVEPFHSQPPSHLPALLPVPEVSAAAQAIIARASHLWGPAGHDFAGELLRTFDPAVVAYAAKETVKKLNGRPFSSNWASYWERICQNNHKGVPAPEPTSGRPARASPAPRFVDADPDVIYHPNQRAKRSHAGDDPIPGPRA